MVVTTRPLSLFFSITPGFYKAMSYSRLGQSYVTTKIEALHDCNCKCLFPSNCLCGMQASFGVRFFFCQMPPKWQSTSPAYYSIKKSCSTNLLSINYSQMQMYTTQMFISRTLFLVSLIFFQPKTTIKYDQLKP